MVTKTSAFIVTGITGTCIACDKETQVFEVVFREQTMHLCPHDAYKQVRIAVAAAEARPNARAGESVERS
ncbi:MAG TPA: hypothetical protein VH475_28580 [Tepidisphaeraceae bacterium]|jgi:hypothetical protein